MRTHVRRFGETKARAHTHTPHKQNFAANVTAAQLNAALMNPDGSTNSVGQARSLSLPLHFLPSISNTLAHSQNCFTV